MSSLTPLLYRGVLSSPLGFSQLAENVMCILAAKSPINEIIQVGILSPPVTLKKKKPDEAAHFPFVGQAADA